MPWHIVDNSSECSSEEPYAVVKDTSGELEGCHPTREAAEEQMRALYASEGEESTATSYPVWEGALAVEGTATGDGREFAEGALTWADLPIPLRWNKEDSHGGDPHTIAVNVGRIDNIWRDGNKIMGSGIFNINEEDGRRVYQLVKDKFLNGISIDADDISDADMEVIWPENESDETEDDEASILDLLFGSPEKIIFHGGRIRAATICDIPAFVEAAIAVLEDTFTQLEDTAIIASAASTNSTITDSAPPSEWFTNPRLNMPTGIMVSDEGRILGHAAVWGECHIGYADTCVTPPIEDTHPYFMTGEVICSDGTRVAVGQITLGTGHAALSLPAHAAAEHYDNTGAAVADVMIGNDSHGIWVSGAVRPGVTQARVRELRASGQLSGDWRRIGGKLRLVGLLAVNVPGFPVPKMTSRVASGKQLALTAAGHVKYDNKVEPQFDQATLRSMMDALIAHVHGEGK
jgi:hypothetical protein